MSKLPVLKPKQVIKKFEKLGFIKDRQSGSHLILYRKKDKKRVVIPLHVNRPLLTSEVRGGWLW